ncbi:MAG: hypothetical protein ACK4I0_09365 [Brevundimonas sp.]|uniref:hypothetical protein n=1 Tax=Brevundimonas sp. TaxID=1871086 RepID=UPI00391D7FE9
MFRAKTLVPALAAALGVLTLAGQAAAQGQGQGQGQPNAQPNCQLAFESGPDQWIIQFDPFADSEAARQFDLAVVNRGSGPCTGEVVVDTSGDPFGLALSGDPQRLPYVLVDERGSIDVTPRTGESARRPGGRSFNLRPGEREILRFSFAVDPQSLLGAGLYSQNVFIGVNHPNGAPQTQKPVTLGVQVASTALMGLKGEFTRRGGLATIDLGDLTQGGRTLNTSLYVLSTGGYRVSVTSANAGRLRQGASDWFVPYGLAIGDRAMNLAQGDQLEVVSRRPRLDDYPLSINIGSTAGRRAGDYSDVLTFTVSAI